MNLVLDQQVSDVKNKWDNGSCTGLNTNEECFYQTWSPFACFSM